MEVLLPKTHANVVTVMMDIEFNPALLMPTSRAESMASVHCVGVSGFDCRKSSIFCWFLIEMGENTEGVKLRDCFEFNSD